MSEKLQLSDDQKKLRESALNGAIINSDKLESKGYDKETLKDTALLMYGAEKVRDKVANILILSKIIEGINEYEAPNELPG